MKRILAVFLTLAMALNIAPVAAFAAADSDAASIVAVEETDENASSQLDEQTARAIASDPFLQAAYAQTEQEQASRAKVDTSDVSMEATDSFGRLLLAGMDEQQTNGTGDGTKKITGVTVSGNTATVEYVSDQIENLVVAIYTDDTEQEMVASGRMATNICQDGKARTDEVKLTGDIPSSFVVKAYLLDYYDYDPLCNAFVSNQYTSGMQELEDATISDFDEARTVNLDGDVTTNFAVVNEGVELLKPEGAAPDENRVAMQDDESLTYVIENADSRVLGLQPGDILVYPQDEGGMLIVKVKDISVSGTTATITGDEDIDLSEVFAVLKIEDSASTEDFEYEQGSAEGVTYAGMAAVPAALGMENGKEIDKDGSVGKELVVDKEFGSLKITGGVYATLGYGIKVMLDGEEKYISMHLDTGLTGTVTLTGKYNEAFEIGELSYTNPFIGLYAGIKPTIEVKADAYVEFTFKANKYNGFEYAFTGVDVKNGTVTDTSKPAECELYTEAKGSLYVGVNLNPETYALWKVVDITMDARIGVTGDFKLLKADKEDPAKESLHTCDYCMTFNLTGSAELTIHLKVSLTVLFVSVESQWDKQLFTTNWLIGEAYYSVVHNEFGWGACPYRTYRVKVAAGINGANAAFSVTKGGSAVVSNKLDANGEYSMFLEPGSYTVKLAANNKEYTKTITVGGSAQTVEFKVKDNSDTGETVGSGKCGDNLTWKLDANGTLTISGSGKMYKYGVGSLGVAAQAPWQELRKDYTVQKLILSEGITSIGSCAFKNSEIGTLDIPSTVTEIDVSAFEYCDKLTTVTGGENVTIISPMAFMGCSELTSFQWSDKLQAVRYYAFKSCKKLNSVELASSVTEIGMEAFKGCVALATVIYHGTEKDWNNIQIQEGNDPLLNAKRTYVDDSTILSGTVGEMTWTYTKDDTLTLSGEGEMPGTSFGSYFPDVKKVVLKNGITSVSNNSFNNCAKLETVELPDGVTSIGEWAFKDCESLKEIRLPDGVTKIGGAAFSGCKELKEFYIPDSVTEIGGHAFDQCESLTEIVIPNGVNSIADATFAHCSALKKITLPDSVTTIGEIAFSECKSLTDITIPDGVKSIGRAAFYFCESLTKIVIPDGVSTIGSDMFSSCSVLEKITIPTSVRVIKTLAFAFCPRLKDVYYTGTQEQWGNVTIYSGNDYLENATVHYNYSASGETVGSGECGDNLTWKLDANGTLTISGTGKMYDYTTALNTPWKTLTVKNVVVEEGVQYIGAWAFTYKGTIESFKLPKSLTAIGQAAFCGTGIESIELPDEIKKLQATFSNCEKLKHIKWPSNLTTIGEMTFNNCVSLTNIEIPDSVTSIEQMAFAKCNGLVEVVIPENVTNLEWGAFQECQNLKKVTFAAKDDKIGKFMFEDCTSLKEIKIPANVRAIYFAAFRNCTELKDVHYQGTKAMWNDISIDNQYDSNAPLLAATIHCTDGDIIPNTENSITTGTATEKSGTYYAAFENAKAGKEYVVIVSKSKGLPLNADNLIYINQITADADGELTVPFRTAADAAEMTYVVACAQDDATDPTPADPDTPSSGGDGGGAIILIGGVAAVAAVAGVVLLMPVKVEGTVKLADQPVANATVQVLKGDAVKAETVTDANGHFTVKVKRGGYTMRVQWTDASGQPMTRTVDFKAPNANLNVAA